jgi:hypothetical protein
VSDRRGVVHEATFEELATVLEGFGLRVTTGNYIRRDGSLSKFHVSAYNPRLLAKACAQAHGLYVNSTNPVIDRGSG